MSLILAMLSYAFVMFISPGPVNMVIVSSGASYGVRKTFAFVSGAVIGFTLLLLFLGLGFYQVIELYPSFLTCLSIAGSLFIVYIGYVIATSSTDITIKKQKLPTFIQGFLLQWLNPKAWVASIAGASLFSMPDNHSTFLLFSLIYFVVCYLSLLCWSLLGEKVTMLLNNQQKLQRFNQLMGSLLIATAGFLLYSQLI